MAYKIVTCFLLIAVGTFLQAVSISADSSSTNYRIKFDSFTYFGAENTSATSYILNTGGNHAVGQSTSTSYDTRQGYGGGVYDPFASFSLGVQDFSSQVAITAQPSANTYTFTDASGFSQGDTVILVSDESDAMPSFRINTIASIAVNDVTLSADSDEDFDSLTVDGTDDYVYEVLYSSGSTGLGLLSSSAVTKRYLTWLVESEADQGYTVYIFENQDLTGGSTGQTIADVADGTVSAGSSEYGAQSTDSTLASSTFDTQDTAITSSPQQIATRSGVARQERDVLVLKTSIEESQAEDTYTQELTVLYVGDY